MARTTRKFFQKGIDKQRAASIIIDIRRPNSKEISKWTLSQKILALAFIKETRSTADAYFNELEKSLQS